MGLLWSYFGGSTGRTDDPDPATGLTSRDKYLIRSSWEIVKKDITGNGVTLLLLLFEKYPDEQKHFPFRDIPTDQLPPNKKFQAHCTSVMYAVTSIVDALNDTELLVQILTKIGENHNRRNIKGQSMWNLKATMLDLFSKIMTKDSVDSWDRALEVCFKVMNKELDG